MAAVPAGMNQAIASALQGRAGQGLRVNRNLIADRRLVAAAAVIAAVVVIGGAIRLTGVASLPATPGDAEPTTATAASPGERFPAFEMTRSVTTAVGTDVLRLVYTDHETWKETVVSSTSDPSRAGDYQELRDGVFTVFARGETFTSDPGLGYRVPGPWFVDEEWLARRAAAAEGVTLTRHAVGSDTTLVLATGEDRTEVRFDAATGIPVSFKVFDSGVLVQHHQVTSLVSGGQTIR